MSAVRTATSDADSGFAPMVVAARFYRGSVMHARLKPFGHRFTYRVFSLLIDLDRLEDAGRLSRLFSVNRRNLVSFHERDHHDGNAPSLRAHADALLRQAGIARTKRIQLLAYPRILGYVFNPLSVYFAWDGRDELTAIIYEVRNTFGERHTYVCPVRDGEVTAAGIRQERDKLFYVSPFIGMAARYHFRILPPDKCVRVRILETEGGDPLLSATFAGEAQPLDDRSIAGNLARIPFLTAKIMLGIHWEALKLYLKGARFHTRPAPPPEVSVAPGESETGNVAVRRLAGRVA